MRATVTVHRALRHTDLLRDLAGRLLCAVKIMDALGDCPAQLRISSAMIKRHVNSLAGEASANLVGRTPADAFDQPVIIFRAGRNVDARPARPCRDRDRGRQPGHVGDLFKHLGQASGHNASPFAV